MTETQLGALRRSWAVSRPPIQQLQPPRLPTAMAAPRWSRTVATGRYAGM